MGFMRFLHTQRSAKSTPKYLYHSCTLAHYCGKPLGYYERIAESSHVLHYAVYMGILGHSYHKTAYIKSDIFAIALKDISYPYFICYSKQAYWCVAYDEIASSKRTLYVVVAALGGGGFCLLQFVITKKRT